jgi:hypothetical protein
MCLPSSELPLPNMFFAHRQAAQLNTVSSVISYAHLYLPKQTEILDIALHTAHLSRFEKRWRGRSVLQVHDSSHFFKLGSESAMSRCEFYWKKNGNTRHVCAAPDGLYGPVGNCSKD